MKARNSDRFLFGLVIILCLVGFFIFTSASLGLLGRSGANFTLIALKQWGLLIAGFIIMLITAKIPYRTWRKFALPLLGAAIFLCLLVFAPGVGLEAGGAKRWIVAGPLSFQPSELLKLAFIIYLAAWLAVAKDKIKSIKGGLMPFILLVGTMGILILAQPDTGTFMVLSSAAIALFLAAGGRWIHFGAVILISVLLVTGLAISRPYIKERIITFVNPSHDTLGSSYQLNQSLIAIGSGGITGRGFGQSVQKFNFLPEPMGDSIFAVAAEEFGFFGAILILTLFLLFAVWGLKIATQAPDPFGRLLAVGIVILITAQSFINMGAMLGLIPLTGVPLVFISHGGSALLIALIEVGILLNISKHSKQT
jgi:cell division protein FtsW